MPRNAPTPASVRPFTLEQNEVILRLAEKLGTTRAGVLRAALHLLAQTHSEQWPGRKI